MIRVSGAIRHYTTPGSSGRFALGVRGVARSMAFGRRQRADDRPFGGWAFAPPYVPGGVRSSHGGAGARSPSSRGRSGVGP
eukprot:6135537-Lingulodinium_polyedra.AAC.1